MSNFRKVPLCVGVFLFAWLPVFAQSNSQYQRDQQRRHEQQMRDIQRSGERIRQDAENRARQDAQRNRYNNNNSNPGSTGSNSNNSNPGSNSNSQDYQTALQEAQKRQKEQEEIKTERNRGRAVVTREGNVEVIGFSTSDKVRVGKVIYSPDGKQIATLISYIDPPQSKEAIVLWDAQSYNKITSFSGRFLSDEHFNYSPDGKLLSYQGLETAGRYIRKVFIRLLDSSRLEQKAIIDISNFYDYERNRMLVFSRFSPDSKKLLAWGGKSGKIEKASVYDTRTGRELYTINLEKDYKTAEYSANGEKILFVSDTGDAAIYNAASGSEIHKYHIENADSPLISPDKKTILFHGGAKKLLSVEAESGALLYTTKEIGSFSAMWSCRFSPDSKKIVIPGVRNGYRDGSHIVFLDAATGGELNTLKRGKPVYLQDLIFTPDAEELALCIKDDENPKKEAEVIIFDAVAKNKLASYPVKYFGWSFHSFDGQKLIALSGPAVSTWISLLHTGRGTGR
jgi:Tol biopolymer transport system component